MKTRKTTLRTVALLSALFMAALSQADLFAFSGQTLSGAAMPGSFTTTWIDGSMVSDAPFANLTSGLVTLTDPTSGSVVFGDGVDTLTLTFDGMFVAPDNTGLWATSGMGTITAGTGAYAAYVSPDNLLSVTSNTYADAGMNLFSVLGNVNAVPEPSALAVLGLPALALLRRRKRA